MSPTAIGSAARSHHAVAVPDVSNGIVWLSPTGTQYKKGGVSVANAAKIHARRPAKSPEKE
jgi:hypothetical protein